MEAWDVRKRSALILKQNLQTFTELSENLERLGFEVETADRLGGFSQGTSRPWDLILIEFVLAQENQPGVGRLRDEYCGPLIVFNRRLNEKSEIMALEWGADDFVAADMRLGLMRARIKAWLRKREGLAADSRRSDQAFGDLTIRWARREAYLKKRRLPLNTVQFEMLAYLARHAGEIVTRDDLFRTLFRREFNGLDRTIDIHISRLRKALKDSPRKTAFLKTVRGQGYLFFQPESA